jgi:hypothetical protein
MAYSPHDPWTAGEKDTAVKLQTLTDAALLIGPMASGTVLSAAVSTFQTLPITFPASRFTATPVVVATASTSADVVCQVAVAAVTTSGANVYFKRATAVATNIMWIAFQQAV